MASLDAERRPGDRFHRSRPSCLSLPTRPIGWLLPTAALVALIIAMLDPITHFRSAFPASDSLLATALVRLPTTESLSSSNADEVSEWLQLRVGYTVEVSDIAGASLVGGRIGLIDGASVAVVVYAMHDMPLTYVALPTTSLISERIEEDDVRTESANGYNVAIWKEHGLVRAVVSPMSSREVSSVAYQCKSKAPI